MFCSHNEVDLAPTIITKPDHNGEEVNWVVIRCTCCEQVVGKKYRLVELVDIAIKEREAREEG